MIPWPWRSPAAAGRARDDLMGGFVPTVLICEDEPALRELIRVSLQGGYSFAEADDGIGCLELVREVQPDVVILDLLMPGRNGLEVLRELRSDERLTATAVVVLTAQPASVEDAIRAGASSVMIKPVTVDEINAAVEHVLAARE
jgi:CheY-like chemotaxis protein